jgi:hypothetical protein
MRHWSDGNGAIVGWAGPENYIGQRTYAFAVSEEDLVGSRIVHHRWANAFLRLADGTTIEESQHENTGASGSAQPAADTDLLVSVEDDGEPEAA